MIVQCHEKRQYKSEDDAWNKFSEYGLPYTTKKEHKVVFCEKCEKYHILSIPEEIEY